VNLFDRLVEEVRAERARQDEKWGVQNHPMVLDDELRDVEYWKIEAEAWKRANAEIVAQRTAQGIPLDRNCAWDGIFAEELAETFAEERPGLQYAEAVQAAGVAFAILDFLNRQSMELRGHYAGCPALDVDGLLHAPELCTCETPRFEARDLNPDGPYAGWAWGVWDNRDKKWHPIDFENSQTMCERTANRLNAQEANQ